MVSALARRQFLLAFAALSLLLLADSSTAHPPSPTRDSGYRVTLEDEWGRPLPEYFHRGDTFVLGRFGDKYQIRIENLTSRRVEAVVSVDGRDAISGRRADFVRQRGYLVPAYGTAVISGFRRSLETVAAFRFTTPDDSYSARMGTPENVGVVGVAFFPEASSRRPVYRRPPEPLRKQRSSARGWPEASNEDRGASPSTKKRSPSSEAPARAGSRSAAPRPYVEDDDGWRSEGRLGTKYGETEDSSVVEVPFRRESSSRPARVVVRRYDDRYGLLARGVDVDGWDSDDWCRGPYDSEPFPDSRFAPPPP